MQPLRDDESGITIVEVLLSLVILGIVLTASFEVMTGNLRQLSDSRARQESSQVATELLEELRAVSPPEVAMYTPATADGDEFVPSSVTCGGNAGWVDVDGAGTCEQLVTAAQGVVLGTTPFQGATGTTTAMDVRTWATAATGANVPADTVRVTVVVDYELPSGAEQIRRSALFSEVSRG